MRSRGETQAVPGVGEIQHPLSTLGLLLVDYLLVMYYTSSSLPVVSALEN